MLFNSLEFLIFFPVVAFIFFLLPHRYRWLHLLISSCIFYMWFIPVYILILFLTILVDYAAGILIEGSDGLRKKGFLVVSIVTNISILGFFKYYNFFAGNLDRLFPQVPMLHILLPIGLSFHTFQAMSYTIEVYRGKQQAERHLGIYSLYVMFFPQLVAGPIERPQNVLPQFHTRQDFNYDRVISGLRQMLWGFFKKIVIADRLAAATDLVFNNPHQQSPLALAIGVFFFTFQIYCDFSGYSDIALGCAKVMGFRLMKNFDNPYAAASVSEFWKRWHISLSTWFRDYLYIPMGGNRVPVPRWYLNLMVVFVVSGFWHGADWTFLAWGALHGFYLVFAIITAPLRDRAVAALGIRRLGRLYQAMQVVTTFLLVSFAWIFFRANTIGDAFWIVRRLGALPRDLWRTRSLGDIPVVSDLGKPYFLLSGFLILFLLWVERSNRERPLSVSIAAWPKACRWAAYYVMLVLTLSLAVYSKRYFIYFQF